MRASVSKSFSLTGRALLANRMPLAALIIRSAFPRPRGAQIACIVLQVRHKQRWERPTGTVTESALSLTVQQGAPPGTQEEGAREARAACVRRGQYAVHEGRHVPGCQEGERIAGEHEHAVCVHMPLREECATVHRRLGLETRGRAAWGEGEQRVIAVPAARPPVRVLPDAHRSLRSGG